MGGLLLELESETGLVDAPLPDAGLSRLAQILE
jgi:hypothetical protein